MNSTDSIERRIPFTMEDVDKSHMTMSLLALCSAAGLINSSREDEIRKTIMSVFSESLAQLTHRESNSVAMNYASQIYDSVLFRCDVYFSELKQLPPMVEKVISEDFNNILAEGSRLILKYFSETEYYAKKAAENALKLSSAEYNTVLNESIKEFRKRYSARFFAKSTVTSFDYPLLFGNNFGDEFSGVMYVHKYYKSLFLENAFCSLFPKAEIHKLMIAYGSLYRSHYSELLFNICGTVLNQFLVNALLGKKVFSLRVSTEELTEIENKLKFASSEQIKNTVRTAFGQYYRSIGDHRVIMYVKPYCDVFSAALYEHLQNDTLGKLIIV